MSWDMLLNGDYRTVPSMMMLPLMSIILLKQKLSVKFKYSTIYTTEMIALGKNNEERHRLTWIFSDAMLLPFSIG